MAQVTARKPLSYWNSEENVTFSDNTASFTDIDFGFLEEFQEDSPKSSSDFGDYNEDDEEENSCDVEENKKFWETQNQLLQVIFFLLFYFYMFVHNLWGYL